MSKDRETTCLHYICAGECAKGRTAEHHGYCQRCSLYEPRARVKHLNIKKDKLNKIKQTEME